MCSFVLLHVKAWARASRRAGRGVKAGAEGGFPRKRSFVRCEVYSSSYYGYSNDVMNIHSTFLLFELITGGYGPREKPGDEAATVGENLGALEGGCEYTRSKRQDMDLPIWLMSETSEDITSAR